MTQTAFATSSKKMNGVHAHSYLGKAAKTTAAKGAKALTAAAPRRTSKAAPKVKPAKKFMTDDMGSVSAKFFPTRESGKEKGYAHAVYVIPATKKVAYTKNELNEIAMFITQDDARRMPKSPLIGGFPCFIRVGKIPTSVPAYQRGMRWSFSRGMGDGFVKKSFTDLPTMLRTLQTEFLF